MDEKETFKKSLSHKDTGERNSNKLFQMKNSRLSVETNGMSSVDMRNISGSFMLLIEVPLVLLCVALFAGCEDGGAGGGETGGSGVEYRDAAADSFKAETNGLVPDVSSYSIPTNTLKPFTSEELQHLTDIMTTNYAGYF